MSKISPCLWFNGEMVKLDIEGLKRAYEGRARHEAFRRVG
jgi:hypothetical protein